MCGYVKQNCSALEIKENVRGNVSEEMLGRECGEYCGGVFCRVDIVLPSNYYLSPTRPVEISPGVSKCIYSIRFSDWLLLKCRIF